MHPPRRPPPPPWRPRFRGATAEVRLGGRPVDLGGIGKGLAVRWAAAAVGSAARGLLVEAGGDCWCGGRAADGGVWRIGVEDPRGSDRPVAVLGLSDRACATSSIRLRRWRTKGGVVHHLIDPRTGRPGGRGLLAVTVVHADPAEAEVWSKVLFLAGRRDIAGLARRQGLAALWVDHTGARGWSSAMLRHLRWTAS